MNVNQKIIAKYMNKSKNYETYCEFFCWAIIEINLSKDRSKSSKFAFVIEISLIQKWKLKKLWPNL